jgi:hypothetical protein
MLLRAVSSLVMLACNCTSFTQKYLTEDNPETRKRASTEIRFSAD